MNSLKLSFLLSAIFLDLSFVYAADPISANSPEQFLQTLYQRYQPWKETQSPALSDWKDLSRYFTRDFIDVLKKDKECQVRTQEICGLNSDPLYGVQDFPESTFAQAVIKRQASHADRYDVTPWKNRTATWQVLKTADGWRVSDVIDANGRSLKETILKEIKKIEAQSAAS